MDVNSVMASAGNFGSNLMTGLWYGLIVAVFLGVVLFLIYRMSFNIDVLLRYKTSTHDQISRTKAKIIRSGDGVEKLSISRGMFKKTYMPAPSPEVIGLTKKGRWFLEVEILSDGAMRYIKKEEISGEPRLHPLNTNDRIFMINEEEKRIARHKKPLAELIEKAVPYIALVIIVGCFLAFFGDVVKPFNERMASAEQSLVEEKKLDLQILQELAAMKNDIQIIRDGEKVESNGQVAVAQPSMAPPE